MPTLDGLSERNKLGDVCKQNAGEIGMINTELIVVDERQLRRTWSDTGFMIERDGAVCSEAVDPAEFDRVYTETDILIEVMEDDIEKEGETK